MLLSPESLLIVAAGVLIAFVNGANDVSKGIATLVGSGVADYRRATLWGTAATGLGGLAGAALAHAMVATFGGGLLDPGVRLTLAAPLGTILGAGAWVLLATRTGLPVSTTHAIVGALVGAGAAAAGPAAVQWSAIGGKIALPLLLSPLAALAATVLVLRSWRAVSGPSASATECVCIEVAEPAPAVSPLGASGASLASVVLEAPPALVVITGRAADCRPESPALARVTLDQLHWATSGATSFARGLNDAPKMVAIVLAAGAFSSGAVPAPPLLFALVTAGMVAGSLVAGRRVTEVLAEKVTRMDHREGFAANLVTALLVGAGAVFGWPMSTTHVSSSAIVGAGIASGEARVRWTTVRDMALAWVVTLPASAGLGALACAAVGRWV